MFFLAGYDNTSTIISIACYLLALNPECQERLSDEIQTIMSELMVKTSDPYEAISMESLSRFEYLGAVLDETLRLYPPAPFTERQTGKDVHLESSDRKISFDLKEGDIVHFPIYSIHRDEEYFPESDVFKPERFLGSSTFPKFAYIPFGSGPRNCIAKSLALLKMKMALLHIIRNFKLSSCEQTKVCDK